MPGIMYHLSFAEEVYRLANPEMDKVAFFSGNLIPDLATDKKLSHHRTSASVNGFFVPDMKLVKSELFDLGNPIKLGMFCHLYLDYRFIEDYLIPEFIWDKENMRVINPRNGNSWSVAEFFAKPAQGGILYNGYTQINKRLLEDGHVNFDTLKMLPDILPDTGIPVYDSRREKTWREELNGYLSEDAPYTGEALDYDRLWKAISTFATQFAEELA